VIALDSSALVKLVLDEPESAALETWLDSRAPLSVTASALVRVELIRAVARAAPAGVARARTLLAGVDLVPITQGLLDAAADLGPSSLRSPDALHLATALGLGPVLDAFVVYDERLAQAATAAGLPVVAPA
jgi:predicted nucleic acid-binding protein